VAGPYHQQMELRRTDVAAGGPDAIKHELNADVSWDSFDPAAYVDHNYRYLRSDDEEIVQIIRDHFGDHFRREPVRPGQVISGIDVGAGANLYPALAMLPWCDLITLYEHSAANVGYLRGQLAHYDEHWDAFWQVLCKEPAYAELPGDPRQRFRRAVDVVEGDLFALDRHRGRWSMGTMFFVAESLSTSPQEFETAVERFMLALEPGAPFAAAFMEGSQGYSVGDHDFPACSVSVAEVRRSLSPFADGAAIRSIGMPGGALRPGYEGMIVACGRRRSE
jgi:hypothetical protein